MRDYLVLSRIETRSGDRAWEAGERITLDDAQAARLMAVHVIATVADWRETVVEKWLPTDEQNEGELEDGTD